MPAPKKKAIPATKISGKNPKFEPNVFFTRAGSEIAKQNRTLSGSKPGVRTSGSPAQNKSLNAGYISGKKDIAAAKRNQATKGEFAGVVAKNAARSAKRPGSASAPSRPGVNTSGYNTASVAAKKDMAAFKRGQAKKK